jgi:hypothetical protein
MTYTEAPGPWSQNFIWFTMDDWSVDPVTGPNGNREEHPLVLFSEPTVRMHMHGADGWQLFTQDRGDIFFTPGKQALRGASAIASLGTAIPPSDIYGTWWSVSQKPAGIIDIEYELDFQGYDYSSIVTSAAFYDEGVCSLTLPYDIADLDPFLADAFPAVVDTLGSGLAYTIGEGWDEGLKGFTGRTVTSNQAWYADFISGLRRSQYEEHATAVYATYSGYDWENPRDVKERTDNEICIRSYLAFNGRLEWKGDDSWGEQFAWLLGLGWLPDLFGIGECPGERTTAVTVCGEFEKSTGGEEYLLLGDGIDPATAERMPVPVGSLVFKHSDVVVSMARWPRINFVCNNNKGTYENAIKTAIEGTIDESFNALIQDKLGSQIPFALRNVFMTGEGVTLVLANSENDPNYGFANTVGLCERRPAQRGLMKAKLAQMPKYTPPPFSWP